MQINPSGLKSLLYSFASLKTLLPEIGLLHTISEWVFRADLVLCWLPRNKHAVSLCYPWVSVCCGNPWPGSTEDMSCYEPQIQSYSSCCNSSCLLLLKVPEVSRSKGSCHNCNCGLNCLGPAPCFD